MNVRAGVSWDVPLLARAYQGWYATSSVTTPQHADAAVLEIAYAECEAITRAHSHTFHLTTALLPLQKRRAMHALYAFCRTTDDIVDGARADAGATLGEWRRRVLAPQPPPGDLVCVAFADARAHYQIPAEYAEQLIQGVARDLREVRYGSFEELSGYCYGVASTVGLMSMHIIGFAGELAIPYAVRLGVALQLTNILRDLGEDWSIGRLYLPQDELSRFGLSAANVAEGRVDDRWRAFMRFQIARTRALYAEAWPGIALLNTDGRFAVAAAGTLYRAILDDIEAHDYDVFGRRAHVSTLGKLRRLPAIWWTSR